MIWFRENWYEELLRQLNDGLSLCQAAAFDSRADGMYVHLNSTQYNCGHTIEIRYEIRYEIR